MRNGYTTGSCAAGAAGAAARILLTGKTIEEITLMTPDKTVLCLPVEEVSWGKTADGRTAVSCAVRKDAGDDPDVTDGILIFARVSCTASAGIRIDGGEGVGRVTKPGLDQPAGEAAINHVPRQMIRESVQAALDDAGYTGGAEVTIYVPEGSRIAPRTFNPRLGIEGGISILGTSGIVHPMSRKALVESIRTEMHMRRVNYGSWICLTPGNFGEKYALETLGIDPEREMQCSNFIGEAIDAAVEYGFDGVLFVSHLGKFVKVAGGIMNTHSHDADCRMELLAAAAVRAGADIAVIRRILDCNTTDDALDILQQCDAGGKLTERTLRELTKRIAFYLQFRCGGKIRTGAVVFSEKHGIAAQTEEAGELIQRLKEEDRNI